MEEPQFTLLSRMELGQWYYNIKTHQLWIVFYSKHTISGISLSDLEQEHAESHTRENFQTLMFYEAEKISKLADIGGITIVRLYIKNKTNIS